ncbi:MAG TPA: 5-methyltetrahydropteroyltriglutamate--homocysteine S-methyltransferase, partial [Burkholderiales bacterium]|nr:5-methyltetrahydropteroyltriglutamate--homocysteine S-methyltransferase [Burkholderiales bacterium]
MKAPFRADHVGSLLRPQELHDLREKVGQGKAAAAELKAAEDRQIREVVKLQEEIGLPAITDGEFRRDWWHIDFLAGFDGVELRRAGEAHFDTRFKGADPKPPTMFVTGKLR